MTVTVLTEYDTFQIAYLTQRGWHCYTDGSWARNDVAPAWAAHEGDKWNGASMPRSEAWQLQMRQEGKDL